MGAALGTDPRINAVQGSLMGLGSTDFHVNSVDRGIQRLRIQNAVMNGMLSPDAANQQYQALGQQFLNDSKSLQNDFKQGAAQGADVNYLLNKVTPGGR